MGGGESPSLMGGAGSPQQQRRSPSLMGGGGLPRSPMGGGGSPLLMGGARSPQQQRRSPSLMEGSGSSRSPMGGSQWMMTEEPAVHVPGGPFQPPPQAVVQRRYGESPVRYRELPYDYEPDVVCCEEKMGRFISWQTFPGRRFYRCKNCGSAQWYDPPFSQYVTNMFGDLRDRVQALKKEVDEQKQSSLEDSMKNLNMK